MNKEVEKIRKKVVEKLIDSYKKISTPREAECKAKVCKEIIKYINSLQEEPVWHDASREQPKEKKVCLIVWNAKSGASTSNLEVAIANPQERRFVTESYPHKTGRQFTIHGENTFSVYEYMDKRDYIPFSDADKWAYADDLLKEPTFDDFIQEGDEVVVNEDGSRFNRSQLERVIARQEEPVIEMKSAAESLSVDSDTYNKIVDECIFGEQKPEENKGNIGGISANWSEEDKDFMYDTLSNLTELKDRYGEGYGNVGKCIDWLKSLRPQNRWKPSETDIMILEKVFNGKIDPKDFQETLSNVLEQLKKLNEKV